MSKIEVSWKKQNKQLDNDAQNNVQLKKQINKQSDMDSLIQNSINDKIYDLKQQALVLTKKLQNQKYKNLQLQTIIKAMKIRMQDDHKIQAISVTDANFQNIETFQRKIKKYEYDLEQINNKTNKVSSVVNQKKHKISLLRTQRVIDSGIFRNIQKQLISSQMQFKKLLIQKVKHQKQYQNILSQYNSLKIKAQQYFQSKQTQQKQLAQQNNYELNNQQQQKYNNDKNKFKQIDRNTNQFRNTIIQSQLRKEQQNKLYEFKIKKLLMNLNLCNGKQFVYNWHNIDSVNQKYFNMLNKTTDQYNNLEEQMKKIIKTIQNNTIKFYKPKADLTKIQQQHYKCQKIKKDIQKTVQSTQQQINTLNNFIDTEQFKQLTKYIDLSQKISQKPTQSIDLQTLTQYLKQIQSKMNQLSFYQLPKLTQQSIILKTGRTEKQKRQQKLEDVMNRVKIYQQSDKIMKKQQFQQEYRKMIENPPTTGSRQLLKKKTKKVLL